MGFFDQKASTHSMIDDFFFYKRKRTKFGTKCWEPNFIYSLVFVE